jgi:hypothetical protein
MHILLLKEDSNTGPHEYKYRYVHYDPCAQRNKMSRMFKYSVRNAHNTLS